MGKGKQVIVFLGPPGSGKGTQALKISQQTGLTHISTGDLFRQHLKQGSYLGKIAKEYLDTGNLVPDSLVVEMVFDRVANEDCRKGYLLDGFPRTVPQAASFEQKLKQEQGVLTIINIQISDKDVIQRLSDRLTCRQCGYIQHKAFSPPKSDGICDRCAGELYQRSDDRPDVIAQRLKTYYEQTAPLIAFYKKNGIFLDINGAQTPESVFENIMCALENSGILQ